MKVGGKGSRTVQHVFSKLLFRHAKYTNNQRKLLTLTLKINLLNKHYFFRVFCASWRCVPRARALHAPP